MTERATLADAGVQNVPAEVWLQAGDTLAGFTPSEGFNCTALRIKRQARWESVLVRGQRAPIVGRVCMDQTMIDVSHIPNIRVGDEVVLIGGQGDDAITAEEVATWLGTINYEVVSEILARVPRVV